MIQIVLFQPEIAQNVGTLLRFGACMGLPIHVIEPCGFILSDQKLRRAGMDYADRATLHHHISWDTFLEDKPEGRLIATTPKAENVYTDFSFQKNDLILMGQESVGLPAKIIDTVDAAVKIPMVPDRRSLNLAVSAGIIASEALRATHTFPKG